MKKVKNLIAVLIALVVMCTSAISASAANKEVQDTANGVLKINIYMDFLDVNEAVFRGSCFLINEDTVLTAAHCVRLSPDDIACVNAVFGTKYTEKEIYKHIKYTVSVRGDVEIPATILGTAYSDLADFAVLKLSQPIGSKVALTLRDSKTVESAETLYTVGFPLVKEGNKLYTASDVSFEQATASKAEFHSTERMYSELALLTSMIYENGYLNQNTVDYLYKNYGIDYNDGFFYRAYKIDGDVIMFSGYSSQGGNSGGPVVDENGNVVGIVSRGTGSEGNSEATAIGQVMEVLDMLNIDYIRYDKDKVTTTTATTTANTTTTTTTKHVVKPDPKGLTTGAIVGIAAAVAAVVIIVVVIILISKKNSTPANSGAPSAAGGFTPPSPAPGASNTVTGAGAEGSEGTTVLSSNASDPNATTVLGASAASAYLLRVSNNEKIYITKPYFKIGKDANRVDYCITGNPAVSRFHASVVSKNGQYFIVDNSTTNHTYVNDSMIPANVETQISNGAKIRLADEKFEFKI